MSMITLSSRFPPLQPLTSFCPRTIVQWNSLPLDAFTVSADPAQFRATVCLKSPINIWSDLGHIVLELNYVY